MIKEEDNQGANRQRLVSGVRGMLRQPKIKGNFVNLTISANDAKIAAEVANTYIEALSYIWNRLNYSEVNKKRIYIESQLPKVEAELKNAEEKLKQFTLLAPQANNVSAGFLGLASRNSQGVEVARLSGELELQNSVYTMLRKEYEAAKLEESKEIPPFSVVDYALVPERPSTPKKKRNMLIGLMLGLVSGVVFAFVQEYIKNTGR